MKSRRMERPAIQPAWQKWKIHTKHLPENFQSKDYSRDLEVDGRIILKCVTRRLRDWKVRGSNPDSGVRFFSSRKRPNRLWGPFCLLFSGYRRYFLGVSYRVVKLTSYLHLIPRLWMSGTNPLVPLYTSMTWTWITYIFESMPRFLLNISCIVCETGKCSANYSCSDIYFYIVSSHWIICFPKLRIRN
jgi:hypothetical protein